ncbi:MAG: hypothetical protein J1F17_00660 [Oscillospiraceae bacterium]|nr:hypothetical protein [Oscillospiraceae bacterium]
MKLLRNFSLASALAIVLILSACSDQITELSTGDRDFCKTEMQAYSEGRTIDMLGNNPEIEEEIATIKVSDQVSIWIATNNQECVTVAPMYTRDNTYYFTGRETVYHIPDIKEKCAESSLWDIYNMHYGIKITLYLFRGNDYTGSDATGQETIAINNENYTLVWTYSQIK